MERKIYRIKESNGGAFNHQVSKLVHANYCNFHSPNECPTTVTLLALYSDIPFCTADKTWVAVLGNVDYCAESQLMEEYLPSLSILEAVVDFN
jgi:hypothetical protein